jgi:hypothetical protein
MNNMFFGIGQAQGEKVAIDAARKIAHRSELGDRRAAGFGHAGMTLPLISMSARFKVREPYLAENQNITTPSRSESASVGLPIAYIMAAL